MKKIIILTLITLTSTSCRRNLATFQATHYETYENYKRLKFNDLKEPSKKEVDKTAYSKSNFATKQIASIEIKPFENKSKKPLKIESQTLKSSKTDFKKNNSIIPQKIFKHKRRGDTWWESINVRLKIGVVLLGIAIIFALLSIEVLAIVFGLASIYMIVRGLRKMW